LLHTTKIITSTKSQTSNTVFLTQHKECLNCFTWLTKKFWNIKIPCTWIVNSYIQCKNKLYYSQINWTDIFIAEQDICSFILDLFWDTLSFACGYFVCILHLHTAIEFVVSQSSFIYMSSMEAFYGKEWTDCMWTLRVGFHIHCKLMKLFIFEKELTKVSRRWPNLLFQNMIFLPLTLHQWKLFRTKSELVPCAHMRQDAICCQVNETAQHQQTEHICSEVQFLISPL
jgi:hypothetical protein